LKERDYEVSFIVSNSQIYPPTPSMENIGRNQPKNLMEEDTKCKRVLKFSAPKQSQKRKHITRKQRELVKEKKLYNSHFKPMENEKLENIKLLKQ
jgi:hypothetical protein